MQPTADEFQEFNDGYWAGYAGCQRFKDGSQPIVASFEDAEIIVDAQGCSVHIHVDGGEEEDDIFFYPEMHEATAKLVGRIIRREALLLRRDSQMAAKLAIECEMLGFGEC